MPKMPKMANVLFFSILEHYKEDNIHVNFSLDERHTKAVSEQKGRLRHKTLRMQFILTDNKIGSSRKLGQKGGNLRDERVMKRQSQRSCLAPTQPHVHPYSTDE